MILYLCPRYSNCLNMVLVWLCIILYLCMGHQVWIGNIVFVFETLKQNKHNIITVPKILNRFEMVYFLFCLIH